MPNPFAGKCSDDLPHMLTLNVTLALHDIILITECTDLNKKIKCCSFIVTFHLKMLFRIKDNYLIFSLIKVL